MGSFTERLMALEKEREEAKAAPTTTQASTPSLDEQARSLSISRGEEGTASFSERLREREKLKQAGVHATSTSQFSAEARNEFLANEARAQGYETEKLGTPGLTDFGVRVDLGLSDTFEEKKVKFQDKFPDGDFIQVQGPALGVMSADAEHPKTILFRRNKYEPFAELDANVLDKFELLGDLADISGDTFAMAGEAILTRGGSLATQLLQLAAGSILGDTVKEVMESVRGYQKETLGQDAQRIAERGAFAVVGGVLTAPITGVTNVARGKSILKLKPGAQEAQEATRALNIPDLLPSQIAANPVVNRFQAQAEATTTMISEYVQTQQARSVAALANMTDAEALGFVAAGKDALANMHRDEVKRLTDIVTGKMPDVSMSRGGRSLQHEVNEYTNRSSLAVDRAYTLAREKGTPEFDIGPLKAAATEVESVVLARGKQVVREAKVLGPDGQPIRIMEHQKVALQKIHPQVAEQIELIKRLDPALPTVKMADGTEATAVDQLRAIRSNLWKLKQTSINADPDERARAEQASTLYSVITKTLKKPKNSDPEFVAAWANANQMASDRFSMMEKLIVVRASTTETPAQFAKRLTQPYQVDNLRVLKSAIPPEQFKLFQRAVVSDMIGENNIDQLGKRLAQFDKETLDELLPRGTQERLKTVALGVDRLNNSGIKDALRNQETFADTVRQLIVNKDEAGLKNFVSLVSTRPPNDKVRRTSRAAIMEQVFNDVVQRSNNGEFIDGKKLIASIKELESTGLGKILTNEDRQTLSQFNKLAPFMRVKADTGTELVAAGLVGQLRQGSSEAFMSLVHLMGIGRMMTNKRFQRILLGSGEKEKWSPAQLRVFGAIVAQEALDAESESQP